MKQSRMDENEVFRCKICGQITAWKDGAADDMPDACSKCWAKRHMLDIENNPDWKPYLEAVKEDSEAALVKFIKSHPSRARWAVALALSLVKWHIIVIEKGAYHYCACCCMDTIELDAIGSKDNCSTCPLRETEARVSCMNGSRQQTYSRILKIYTEHFNKLPARDKQRLAA